MEINTREHRFNLVLLMFVTFTLMGHFYLPLDGGFGSMYNMTAKDLMDHSTLTGDSDSYLAMSNGGEPFYPFKDRLVAPTIVSYISGTNEGWLLYNTFMITIIVMLFYIYLLHWFSSKTSLIGSFLLLSNAIVHRLAFTPQVEYTLWLVVLLTIWYIRKPRSVVHNMVTLPLIIVVGLFTKEMYIVFLPIIALIYWKALYPVPLWLYYKLSSGGTIGYTFQENLDRIVYGLWLKYPALWFISLFSTFHIMWAGIFNFRKNYQLSIYLCICIVISIPALTYSSAHLARQLLCLFPMVIPLFLYYIE